MDRDNAVNKKLAEIEKRTRDRELSDIKKIAGTPEGRRFMWRLMAEASVFQTCFTGNSGTFYKEGRRDMGLLVLNDLNIAKPEAFMQMQAEFKSEQEQHDKEVKEASNE